MNPIISIIVPIYNVEKYLARCLNSLVNQTMKEIEIICVNDGSPDQSQVIIDEFVKDYPKQVISIIKQNGGLADARNHGLHTLEENMCSLSIVTTGLVTTCARRCINYFYLLKRILWFVILIMSMTGGELRRYLVGTLSLEV